MQTFSFHGYPRLTKLAGLAPILMLGLTVSCHPDNKIPKPKDGFVCGKIDYEANTPPKRAAFENRNHPNIPSESDVGTGDPNRPIGVVRQFAGNERAVAREIVQIRFYDHGSLEGTMTGVVIDRHTILTAAHGFYPTQLPNGEQTTYNNVEVAFLNANNVWIETPMIAYFIDPRYDADWENTGGERTQMAWGDDLAMLQVAIDFERHGIEPVGMGQHYIPARDCNDCAIDALDLWGYGRTDAERAQGRNQDPDDRALRTITSRPLNSVADAQETNVLTFPYYDDPGDSGGPAYRLNRQTGFIEVVGVVSGNEETANNSHEVGPGAYGDRHVTVVSTITERFLADARNLAHEWRDATMGLFPPRFPAPMPTLPNGVPNPTATSYPENGPAGPATPIRSESGVNGYFVGTFPFPNPTALPTPGPAGGCG
jgi:hypothetical protein